MSDDHPRRPTDPSKRDRLLETEDDTLLSDMGREGASKKRTSQQAYTAFMSFAARDAFGDNTRTYTGSNEFMLCFSSEFFERAVIVHSTLIAPGQKPLLGDAMLSLIANNDVQGFVYRIANGTISIYGTYTGGRAKDSAAVQMAYQLNEEHRSLCDAEAEAR